MRSVSSPSQGLLDRFGAFGSLLCALHCAALPLLISSLPALGLGWWASYGFEAGFVLFASLLGLTSLSLGFRRHRAYRAWWFLVPGLAALWSSLLYAPLHQAVVPHAVGMTFGGTLVAVAHLVNLRLSHGHVHDARCGHAH